MSMLVVQWKCERCGQSATGNDEFCVFCGAPLGNPSASADIAEPTRSSTAPVPWSG